MIKIFSFDKIIHLISDKPDGKLKKGSILIEVGSKDELDLKYRELVLKKETKEIYFFNPDLKKLLHYFSSLFLVIEAAGGLVKNDEGKWLFIFRNNKWDLPKGKIEKGEGIKTAAKREVEEECGISKLSIVRELQPTYHIYNMNNKEVLKKTYWFEMMCKDDSELIPQLEEGITDVEWIAADDLKQVNDNTFESVKEVLREMKD